MSAATPKILSKVRKLLRLAQSPNPHEASRAEEEAARLMQKHGVSLADVEGDVVEVVEDRRDPRRQELARVVSVARRCNAIVRHGQIAFRGHRRAVDIGRDLYRRLVDDVVRHCEIGPRDPGRHVWRICYWDGFTAAVTERLRQGEVPDFVEPSREAPRAVEARRAEAEATESVVRSARVEAVDEAKSAVKEFASFFLPEDTRTAIERLCRDAYDAGRKHGADVCLGDVGPAFVALAGGRS